MSVAMSNWSLGALLLVLMSCQAARPAQQPPVGNPPATALGGRLPPPVETGTVSLEQVLRRRRSVRQYDARLLSTQEISQLLWSAQGITSPEGLRTAPSAGALYPLELYVATADGLFHYEPAGHRLTRRSGGDSRPAMQQAAFHQEAVGQAPAVFVIAGVYARTASKYGTRAERYVILEAGHAAQNLLLQAVALGLGAVPIGAFDDAGIRQALDLPSEYQPLYLIPVGHPAP